MPLDYNSIFVANKEQTDDLLKYILKGNYKHGHWRAFLWESKSEPPWKKMKSHSANKKCTISARAPNSSCPLTRLTGGSKAGFLTWHPKDFKRTHCSSQLRKKKKYMQLHENYPSTLSAQNTASLSVSRQSLPKAKALSSYCCTYSCSNHWNPPLALLQEDSGAQKDTVLLTNTYIWRIKQLYKDNFKIRWDIYIYILQNSLGERKKKNSKKPSLDNFCSSLAITSLKKKQNYLKRMRFVVKWNKSVPIHQNIHLTLKEMLF